MPLRSPVYRFNAVSLVLLSTVLLVAPLFPAMAGPVAEFETLLRDAYADYRAVLFHSNTNNAGGTTKAVAAFGGKWAAISAKYTSPPPQYADDIKWPETLSQVKTILDRGNAVAAKGDLPAAHEAYEEIRDVIQDLHLRNGIIGFSERMNAFHLEMEHVLTRKYDGFSLAGLGQLREDSAVLAYLAAQLKRFPPADAASDPEFNGSLQTLQDSIAALQSAARTEDAEKTRAALGKIKLAYAKLFLKFG